MCPKVYRQWPPDNYVLFFYPHQPESSGGSALALAIAGAASASKLGVSLGVPEGYVSTTGNKKVAVRADLV
ncbi:MAG TPA: hypothetical protein V6D30_04475 [Leptolyngbyaceae cyanobacterium]